MGWMCHLSMLLVLQDCPVHVTWIVVVAAPLAHTCRKSWEYKLARRVLLTSVTIAGLGSLAVFVACDFDDARAASVLRSVPRTLGAAGWCLQAAWTYKTSQHNFLVSC